MRITATASISPPATAARRAASNSWWTTRCRSRLLLCGSRSSACRAWSGSVAAADAAEERIVGLLTARGARFRVHTHPVSRTVADAKAGLPFPPDQLLKTVVFRVKDGRWLLVACKGDDRVDYRRLADAAGARRADIQQPPPGGGEAAPRYAIGGVCPFSPPERGRAIAGAGARAGL